MPFTIRLRLAAAFLAAAAAIPAQAQLAVVSTSPAINAANVARTAPIVVNFDRPVNTATFVPANFKAFGRWSGPLTGPVAFSNGNQTVTLTPARPPLAGETVMVLMSRNLRGADGTALRAAGYTVLYTTASAPSARVFRERTVFSNRDSTGAQTRIYGGLACDLDIDGWPDLTLVNEVSADLRVFMNRADGSGLFQSMLPTYTAIPVESSPNEPADFNGDGLVDIVTSSFDAGLIAVCMGNGDGTFDPAVTISVGPQPRGFGILDADGDGDMDITVAVAGLNHVKCLLNNGNGTFAAPTTFEGGVGSEYGMTATDMDEDGILDLVVGGVGSQSVRVVRGNGDGTFTAVGTARPVSGGPWVVVCADMNNDGNMDVTTANSFGSTGSILLGNGDGTLQPATNYPVAGHCVATDLVDLEGDGDVDWVLSSFGGGTWHILTNNGAGAMTPWRVIDAPANPSCALPADWDSDGDIDLALTDEIADVVVMLANVCPGDFNTQGGVTVQDIFDFLAAYFGNSSSADANNSGTITVQDVFDFLAGYFSACA